jgi:hypothetical protein
MLLDVHCMPIVFAISFMPCVAPSRMVLLERYNYLSGQSVVQAGVLK